MSPLLLSMPGNERFTAALDLLRCAVILTDVNGGIVYTNHSAEDMLNEGSSLRSRHNVVRATRPSACHELSAALKLAARADVGIEKTGWTVKLSEDDTSPVMAHVLPLATTEFHDQGELSAAAAIFIRGREDARADSSRVLGPLAAAIP